MVVLLVVTIIIAAPVLAGLRTSRKERGTDRRHFAAFVGFIAGVSAIVATIAYLTAGIVWFGPRVLAYYHPTEQGIVFVLGCIGILSSVIAFFAGFFGRGIQRVTLVLIFGPVMGLIYLFAAFSNFGG
jgi:hypothetical protein